MGAQQATTYSKTLTSYMSPVAATSARPIAFRMTPSRDRAWQLQRVRLVASSYIDGGGPPGIVSSPSYVVYTNQRGVPAGFCGFGAWPVAGVWKNSINPENEIVWCGCVPASKLAYEPQMPVVVTQSDALILAIYDATDFLVSNTAGLAGVHANFALFNVRFDIDVLESTDER